MAVPADPFDSVHIRKFCGNMKTQTFAELLIDAEGRSREWVLTLLRRVMGLHLVET